jgi:uncharacterized protein
LEAKILYDADKLDAIGAAGIARAYAMAGAEGHPLWADVPPDYGQRKREAGQDDWAKRAHTPVHEFVFKLSKLGDKMHTTTARRMALARHDFMVSFFERLDLEMRGEL